MLQDLPQPKVNDMVNENGSENLWIQQDGETSRTSCRSIEILRDTTGHVVSIQYVINWPTCSSDLTLCDFFLWGYLKSKVTPPKPGNFEEAITN